MFLVDSSVWINHFRQSDGALIEALNRDLVACHPFIVGELALGSLKNREAIIALLNDLPFSAVAENGEILRMVEERRLYSRGLGLIDAHLLGSAFIQGDVRIWTVDKRFALIAAELGLSAHPLN